MEDWLPKFLNTKVIEKYPLQTKKLKNTFEVKMPFELKHYTWRMQQS